MRPVDSMTAPEVLGHCRAIADASRSFGAAATTNVVLPEGMDGIVVEVARLAGASVRQFPTALRDGRFELVCVDLFDSAVTVQSSYRVAEPQRISP